MHRTSRVRPELREPRREKTEQAGDALQTMTEGVRKPHGERTVGSPNADVCVCEYSLLR